jgi:hypothetical protein
VRRKAGCPLDGLGTRLLTHSVHCPYYRLSGESPPGSQRTWDVVAALAQRRHVQCPSQPADNPFSSSPLSDTSSGPDVGGGAAPPAPLTDEEASREPRRRSMDQLVRVMSASPYP